MCNTDSFLPFLGVQSTGVTLADGAELPCGLVVWSTGLAPRYFTRNLNVPKTERGQVMHVMFENLFKHCKDLRYSG